MHARVLVVGTALYAATGALAFRPEQVVLVPGRGCEPATTFDYHLLFIWSSFALLIGTPETLTLLDRNGSVPRTSVVAAMVGGIGSGLGEAVYRYRLGSGLGEAVYRYRLGSNPVCPGFQICSGPCQGPPGWADHLVSMAVWGAVAGLMALPVSLVVRTRPAGIERILTRSASGQTRPASRNTSRH